MFHDSMRLYHKTADEEFAPRLAAALIKAKIWHLASPDGRGNCHFGVHQDDAASMVRIISGMQEEEPSKSDVAVVCRDTTGAPDIFFCTVECSNENREAGKHHELAINAAVAAGYSGEYVSIDSDDPAAESIKWPEKV